MPSSKGKGNGKGSPQKKAAARRVQTRSTKSKKQARIEEAQFDTLATVSSPKPKSNPKKLTPPSESTTSPLSTVGKEETPERRKSIAQPVTETKQAKSSEESSNDGNSTGDESALLVTHPVTMAANLTAGADQRLDTQLDHILEEFLLTKGGNHEIRQMFKECNVYQFEDFVDWE